MTRFPLALLAVAALLTGCQVDDGPYFRDGTYPGFNPGHTRPAAAGAVPPYHREAFGGWATVRGNCDTREIVLEREAGPNAVDTDGDGCKDDVPVLDPYTGRLVDPAHVDADHVFPLRAAWDNGAWQWSAAKRHDFANDLNNLLAVGASINRSKSDRTSASWRPPARSGWCVYARTYEGTARRWGFTIPAADVTALKDMETTCQS